MFTYEGKDMMFYSSDTQRLCLALQIIFHDKVRQK